MNAAFHPTKDIMFQRISKRFLSTAKDTSSLNKGISNNGSSSFSFKRSLGYSLAIGGVACLAVASISQTNPNGNLTSLEAQGPKSSSKALPAAGVKGGVVSLLFFISNVEVCFF